MAQQQVIVVLEEQEDNNQNWIPLHQSLLMLFDSPLNHENYLQVYIKLSNNRLIKLHREVRIPRTFKRFDQLFNNFIQGCDLPLVDTKEGKVRLLQFVNKPLEKVLINYAIFRISNLAPKLKTADYFTDFLDDSRKGVAILVEFGPVDFNILGDGREEEYEIKTIKRDSEDNAATYSISRYPISAAMICVKLATSFEKALDVF